MIWFLICLVKKLSEIISELFTTGRKLSISLVFITQSSFAVPKNINLKEIFNKLCLIIHQIMTLKTL